MKQKLSAELMAEFLGTLVLILFGNGVVAMVMLFGTNVPGEVVKGGYTNITLAWGLAVTMGIYIAGKITGAHLNPAVTIALAAYRGFPWSKVIPYCIVQVAGAFVAAALVFWNYHPAFLAVDPGLDHTAGVFTTFPAFPAAAVRRPAGSNHRNRAADPDDFRHHRRAQPAARRNCSRSWWDWLSS